VPGSAAANGDSASKDGDGDGSMEGGEDEEEVEGELHPDNEVMSFFPCFTQADQVTNKL